MLYREKSEQLMLEPTCQSMEKVTEGAYIVAQKFATLVFGYHFDMAKTRILTQAEIARYMNNLDELSDLSENGLEYSDDNVDFLHDCVSSNEDSDSDSYLSKEGIYSLGTINRNRIPNSKISTENVFNKMERGHSMGFVGNYNDVEISVTAWKDNKIVIMASTFAGEKQLGKVSRYDKKTKERIEIIRPHVIEEYNKHMGGVNLLVSIIARHKTLMRSKKWYMRIHLF
ncbi:piggyBac transposable element-derived protein 3-like [Stegodyphus dumicola]|uniref:piggyBac transposable element-derived protein 3-like n=1 Tax=Stegodyphus dumicola TaxID=202533 RepID=UPI0015AE86B0|nr:piggyBac transposable element-derived protein 3-like [Stegodyphus dumicola]